eukprot:3525987-Ditylum_brightwellii.AAC.1
MNWVKKGSIGTGVVVGIGAEAGGGCCDNVLCKEVKRLLDGRTNWFPASVRGVMNEFVVGDTDLGVVLAGAKVGEHMHWAGENDMVNGELLGGDVVSNILLSCKDLFWDVRVYLTIFHLEGIKVPYKGKVTEVQGDNSSFRVSIPYLAPLAYFLLLGLSSLVVVVELELAWEHSSLLVVLTLFVVSLSLLE